MPIKVLLNVCLLTDVHGSAIRSKSEPEVDKCRASFRYPLTFPPYYFSSPHHQLAQFLKVPRDQESTMTEPLGAISAVAGIATFLVQVGKGIKIVRRAIHYNRNQASDDLQALDIDLNSLHKVIDALSAFETDPLVALAIAGCQQSYNEMEPDLDRLAQIFGSDKSAKSRLKSFKRRTTLNAEDSVKELRTKIGQIVQALMQ